MHLRTLLVLPVYDNPESLPKVLESTLAHCDLPILIVDDGSKILISELLGLSDKNQRVHVIRHAENCGKGAALQSAIQYAVKNGFTHILAMDADGQHMAEDIHKFLCLQKEKPWALIVGSRKFQGPNVPESSYFGRKFSNFWVSYQTGHNVSDSQSGFRLYPLFYVQNINFWTKRYDFEIEVLIRLMWKQVEVSEVEIAVHYEPKEKRVTHFNKLWDNVRISLLNTVLVFVSMLRGGRSKFQYSLAMAVGVLIGTTPLFGFHTLMTVIAAFVFRLNFPLLFIGSNISFPPFIPFLFIASMYVGGFLVPAEKVQPILPTMTWEFEAVQKLVEAYFTQWLLGSLVLGAALGVIAGAICFLVMQGFSKKNNVRQWNGRARGGSFGNWFLKVVIENFGINAGYLCLLFIIPYFYIFAPRGRRGLNEYYTLVDQNAGWWRRQWLVLKHFYKFGQILMDRIYIRARGTQEFRTNPTGMNNILKPIEQNKGLILLTAHVGGWEQAGLLLDQDGFRSKLEVLHYSAVSGTFEKFFGESKKEHVDYKATNQMAQPIFVIHELLKNKKPLALMADRVFSDNAELVLFLGKLAVMDSTAFRLAATTKTPLVMTYGFKAKNNVYDFFANVPVYFEYESNMTRQESLYKWTQAYALDLEKYVRQYPDQWFNFYKFWSDFRFDAFKS